MLGSHLPALALALFALCVIASTASVAQNRRPHVLVRGVYGSVPTQLLDRGVTLRDFGLNAVWIGSGSVTQERVELLRQQGMRLYVEFNTLHEASYLRDHPSAAPAGPDGHPSPPPDGWQGICPTHPGYRQYRMGEFRRILREFEVDGIWLDYHHSHASWEQAVPNLPDTCFCERCLEQFRRETKTDLPRRPAEEISHLLLGPLNERWVQWRCDVFTDWVREFREILDATRPGVLLGTFHCPWSDTDYDGALRNRLAIDLKAQARYLDVLSPMPYHARFGHASDPAWISRQTAWLGRYLGITGEKEERLRICPIVQLSNWGEAVPLSQVREVLDHGSRPPATGITVFNWGSLQNEWDKVEALGAYYREIRP